MPGAPACDHPAFDAHVSVIRIADQARVTTDIQIRCAVCHVRFRFLGVPMGLDPGRPMVSVDGFGLRAPITADAHMTSLMADGSTSWPPLPPGLEDPTE